MEKRIHVSSKQSTITDYIKTGYTIQSDYGNVVILVKKKQMSRLLLIPGLILIIVYGIGLIFLLLALLDYVIKKDSIITLDVYE